MEYREENVREQLDTNNKHIQAELAQNRKDIASDVKEALGT